MPNNSNDGDYRSLALVAPTKISFPFLNAPSKDATTKLFLRRYEIDRASYTNAAALSTLPNDGTNDPADASAYLLTESEPQVDSTGTVTIERLYGYIPATQYAAGTRTITKPSPAGAVGAVQRNVQLVISNAFPRNLTANPQFGLYLFVLNTNAAGYNVYNKVYGPLTNVAGVVSGSDYVINWPAHGLTGAEQIAQYNGGYYIFQTGSYVVINADAYSLTGMGSTLNGSNQAAKYLRDYTPGVSRVATNVATSFYLPGVNVANVNAIPVPAVLLTDATFLLTALNTTSGFVTYDAKDLAPWMGPIYQQEVTQINMTSL